MSGYKLVCPHCHSKLRIRTSDGKHIFLRLCYMTCTNDACGFRVKAQFEMTHELVASAMPRRGVVLPKATLAMRREVMLGANSNQPDLLDQLDAIEDL
ncbi:MULTISPECIES: ogr/Delta-like zinc finger family protein [unclassified Pseudomonas]|uniref:ogr/Delta-like zinc finger family protein n=1 Tax=unclassified Pseudomonas TaxID=196821 RepID=UPI002362FA42|nr:MULTISPECIES: ogr/Delta-like zinc finger family protein [unclassified Pseudomonas]